MFSTVHRFSLSLVNAVTNDSTVVFDVRTCEEVLDSATMTQDHTPGAVEEAVALLLRRRLEAQEQVRELSLEVQRITAAIEALQQPGDQTRQTSDRIQQFTERAIAAVTEKAVSVRTYVQKRLDEDRRAWSSGELVAAIERDRTNGLVNITAQNIPSSVRSALWAITNEGQARRLADDRVISAKWMPKPENAAESSPQTGHHEEARLTAL